MRALATLIVGLGLLFAAREYLGVQFDEVRSVAAQPAEIPEMKAVELPGGMAGEFNVQAATALDFKGLDSRPPASVADVEPERF